MISRILLWLIAASVSTGSIVEAQQAFQDAAPPGLYVGSVFHGYSPTWEEPDYQTLALKHFNIMTSSIYLPTVWTSPSDEINVAPFAKVAEFLKDRNILVHGHSLLYPGIATLANWWNEQPVEEVETNFIKYMTAVVEAGKGFVYSWDVVNEVMGDDNNDMDEDGVRRAQFSGPTIREYDAMGQDYIRRAFLLARAADPDAKLMLTDYGCEEDSLENDNEKSDRLYRFVAKLLEEGIPIDGIGFQLHVESEGSNPDYLAIARNFERFRKLGLLIYITEMDVISYSTRDPENAPRDELIRASRFQARVYRRILEVCMEEPACQSFRFWDFAEFNSRVPDLRYCWLHPITYDANRFGVYTYPTPFWDINATSLQPKPAWGAMIDAMNDFSENEGGIYRITSGWQSITSYMARDGVLNSQGGYDPGTEVQLQELNENSISWSSMKWRLERVTGETNMYRIQCLWAKGYLSRDGEQNPDGRWKPVQTLGIYDLHMNWTSQIWVIEYRSDEAFTIRSAWNNGSDYLTRRGAPNGEGGYDATNEIGLQSDENYVSQQWYLERTL